MNKKVLTFLAVTMVFVLAFTLVACGKSKNPDEPKVETIEYVNGEEYSVQIKNQLYLDSNCRFEKTINDFDEEDMGSIRISLLIEAFAENLETGKLAKSKADKLLNGISKLSIFDDYHFAMTETMLSNFVEEIYDVIDDAGLTADDASIIVTALYKAVVSTMGSTDYSAYVKTAAENYLTFIHAKYTTAGETSEADAAILAYLQNKSAYRFAYRYLTDYYSNIDGDLTEQQFNFIAPIINSLFEENSEPLSTYAEELAKVNATDEPDEKPDSLIILANNALQSAVNPAFLPADWLIDEKAALQNYYDVQDKIGDWLDIFFMEGYTVASSTSIPNAVKLRLPLPTEAR